jgi:hypothetical protein
VTDIFDTTVKTTKKSLLNYIHLLIKQTSELTGYSFRTIKENIFKGQINNDFFLQFESGQFGEMMSYKSVNDLTKEDLQICLNRFEVFFETIKEN